MESTNTLPMRTLHICRCLTACRAFIKYNTGWQCQWNILSQTLSPFKKMRTGVAAEIDLLFALEGSSLDNK